MEKNVTAKKKLKKEVRERAAKTGESYSSARMHVVEDGKPKDGIELSSGANLTEEPNYKFTAKFLYQLLEAIGSPEGGDEACRKVFSKIEEIVREHGGQTGATAGGSSSASPKAKAKCRHCGETYDNDPPVLHACVPPKQKAADVKAMVDQLIAAKESEKAAEEVAKKTLKEYLEVVCVAAEPILALAKSRPDMANELQVYEEGALSLCLVPPRGAPESNDAIQLSVASGGKLIVTRMTNGGGGGGGGGKNSPREEVSVETAADMFFHATHFVDLRYLIENVLQRTVSSTTSRNDITQRLAVQTAAIART